MGDGCNLRGVSHSAGRHMVFTHYCVLSAQGEETDGKDFPINHRHEQRNTMAPGRGRHTKT